MDYQISTITVTACLKSDINILSLYDNTHIGPVFKYIEYGPNRHEVWQKGTRRKKTRRPLQRFNNQVTVTIQQPTNVINAKIFKNGSVQITGLRDVNLVTDPLEVILSQIRETNAAETPETLMITDVSIVMINANLQFGFRIKRDVLCKVLHRDYVNRYASFDPSVYPGVKVHYNWNTDNISLGGICSCKCRCDGKGHGNGDGSCNRTTITFFQSGCCLLAGAICMDQLDSAVDFAKYLVTRHRREIELV